MSSEDPDPVNLNVAPRFCNCTFTDFEDQIEDFNPDELDKITCRCGQTPDIHRLQWTWEPSKDESDAIVRGEDIVFHPIYSQGNAVILGNKNLERGMFHYWEIRIITKLSGTDIMLGIATDSADFEPYKYEFSSGLGNDGNSWGYSFNGCVKHNHIYRYYGRRYSQGAVVGALLDRTKGRLEFFVNRRPMGLAYHNIPLSPKVKIYPVISSTAAQSCMRLINAISEPDCLKLRAYRSAMVNIERLDSLIKIPGLRYLVNTYWFLKPEIYMTHHNNNHALELFDEALIPNGRRRRRMLRNSSNSTENNDQKDDDDDDETRSKLFVAGTDTEEQWTEHDLMLAGFLARMQRGVNSRPSI